MSREASIDYTALQIITCLPGVMSFHALPHLVAKLFYVRKKSEQLYFFSFFFLFMTKVNKMPRIRPVATA